MYMYIEITKAMMIFKKNNLIQFAMQWCQLFNFQWHQDSANK